MGSTVDRSVKEFKEFSNFDHPLSRRVSGQSINSLFAVEIFSGTAGLTASLRRIGMTNSVGIDAHVTKQVRAPMVRIDLATDAGCELLWRVLRHERLAYVHLGPPCGTSSRARDIRRRSGPDPKPLRSTRHPDGLPSLQGVNALRVATANKLYSLAGQVFAWCAQQHIPCTLENPSRSHFWNTTALLQHVGSLDQYHSVYFHHCMYGSKRKKRTRLLCTPRIFGPRQ